MSRAVGVALLLLSACGSRGGDAPEPIQYTAPPIERPSSAPPVEPPSSVPPVEPPSHEVAPPGGALGFRLSADVCTTDADCVPAACCHATACVGRANAPSCGDTMCTQDCRYGTLDCGGACFCHEGRCAARLSQPPAALGGDPMSDS